MTFLISATIDGCRQYVAGPRLPALVRSVGYGFTGDWQSAWPFESEVKAKAKARIVAKHMGWPTDRITIEKL